MTIRVDVLEDCRIEVMIPRGRREPRRLYPDNEKKAVLLVEYFLRKDLAKARKETFVPQIQKEAKEAYKQLCERSPYHGER